MKNLLLIAFISLLSLNCFAQNETSPLQKNHEIKINVLTTAMGNPEFSYEYIPGKKLGLGFSISYLNNDYFTLNDNVDKTLLLIPYMRLYMTQKKGRGFFIEAYGAIFSDNNKVVLGGGSSLGGKFALSKKRLAL